MAPSRGSDLDSSENHLSKEEGKLSGEEQESAKSNVIRLSPGDLFSCII